MIAVWRYFAPKPSYMYIYRPVDDHHLIAPYTLQQLLARKYPSGIFKQQRKQLKLFARQLNLIAIDCASL